ncbi:MAG: putative type secretion-associated protein ImpA family [Pedosphaera sp.]|nr:putative type secretion-associated protein ImpA family [Pedosphaera sp.]
MISVEELLQPISPEQPCGEDFTYHPSLQELDTLVQGKPETQVGDVIAEAEDPDWKAVLESSVEILKQSKHLRVGVTLCLAELKVDGFPGFRDSLAVLRGLLEVYWNDIYPKLDPDDNNDPTERINILNNLSAPVGTFGDPYRFLQRLRQVPLCNSVRMGRVTLGDILDAEDPDKQAPEPAPEGDSGEAAKPKRLGTAQISAAFRDSDQAAIKETYAAVGEIIDTVAAINTFLTESVGAGNGVTFDDLTKSLKKIQSSVAPYTGDPAAAASADGQGAATGEASSGGMGDGKIRSRDDVVFMLDQICDFYARSEPSSPVPLLLKRAQRLATMSFFEIINDLTPDSISQLKVIAGKDPNETTQE